MCPWAGSTSRSGSCPAGRIAYVWTGLGAYGPPSPAAAPGSWTGPFPKKIKMVSLGPGPGRTARLGRPLSTQYMGAKRSSSIRGSASFRKTSAQLLSRRLAFFGVTRNWDCQRLSCGSRIRNILPSLGQAQRPRPFITLSPPCPRLARGFYEQINFAEFDQLYGNVASVITLMVWAYVCAIILILGAELASEYGRLKMGLARGEHHILSR